MRAMENWGAITFIPSCFELTDENFLAEYRNARVLAHEISHMWLGDLVSVEWWDEIWLNEGFARYMEFVCIDAIKPELQMWKRFIADVHCAVLTVDYPIFMTHSMKLNIPANSENISKYFDSICYFKGAALLKMLEDIMGSEQFHAAVVCYVQKYQYKNVTSISFFEEAKKKTAYPISEIMQVWVKNISYPLLIVEKKNFGFRITQRAYDLNSDLLWPIVVKYQLDSGKFGEVFIESNEGGIEEDGEWVKLNCLTRGYYRVLYKDYAGIFKNIKDFAVEDRIGVLSDSIFHFNQGLVDCEHMFAMISSMIPEYEYVVLNILGSFFNKLLSDNRLHSYLIQTIHDVFRPIWDKYQLNTDSSTPDFYMLRTLSYSFLIEKCNNEEIIQTILSSHPHPKEIQSFYYASLLSLGPNNIVFDLICTDPNFAIVVLEKSANLEILKFSLNFYRFSWEKDSFGFEVIDKLRNKKDFWNGEQLLMAVLLEFKQGESLAYKGFLKNLAVNIAENSAIDASLLISFIKFNLKQCEEDPEKTLLLTNCSSIIAKTMKKPAVYERVYKYFLKNS